MEQSLWGTPFHLVASSLQGLRDLVLGYLDDFICSSLSLPLTGLLLICHTLHCTQDRALNWPSAA